MSREIDDLVALFADKLRMQGVLREAPLPGSGRLVVDHHGERVTVVLPEPVLRDLLAEGDDLAAALWEPSTGAEEAAARMLTIHLDESLDSVLEGPISGTWAYEVGGFVRIASGHE